MKDKTATCRMWSYCWPKIISNPEAGPKEAKNAHYLPVHGGGQDDIYWSELKLGKHKGKTLPETATGNPDWYYREFQMKLFPPPVDEQADLIGYQLGNIKPPRPDPDNWRFEYICSNNSDRRSNNIISQDPKLAKLDVRRFSPILTISIGNGSNRGMNIPNWI